MRLKKIEVGFMWTELTAETGRYEEKFDSLDRATESFQSLVNIEKPESKKLEKLTLGGLFAQYFAAEKAFAKALFESGRYLESLQCDSSDDIPTPF